MANSEAAKKRIRQNRKRYLRNRVRKERLKKALRAFDKALETKDQSTIAEELKKASKAVDHIGGKGLMHKNAISRKKSRLAKAAARAVS